MTAGTIIKRVGQEACNGGQTQIKYRIQLVDETLIDEAVAFMVEHFIPHENLLAAFGTGLNEEEIKKAKLIWKNHLSQGISLAAFLEADQGRRGAMISCNVLDIVKKTDSQNQNSEDYSKISFQGDKWITALQTLEDVEAKRDVFENFDCLAYIHAMGLAVTSAYQRRGIAVEMLLARGAVCRMMNTPVSATVFTGEASQKAAVKCGYETLSELDLTTYRINDQIVYKSAKWPVIKWMAKRYY